MNELVHKRAQAMVVMGFLAAWSLWLPTNLMLNLSLSTLKLTFE